MSMLSVGVSEDQLPEFTDEVDNRTVVAGREAVLSCHVQHLGSYKVTSSNSQQDINSLSLNLTFWLHNNFTKVLCCTRLLHCCTAAAPPCPGGGRGGGVLAVHDPSCRHNIHCGAASQVLTHSTSFHSIFPQRWKIKTQSCGCRIKYFVFGPFNVKRTADLNNECTLFTYIKLKDTYMYVAIF